MFVSLTRSKVARKWRHNRIRHARSIVLTTKRTLAVESAKDKEKDAEVSPDRKVRMMWKGEGRADRGMKLVGYTSSCGQCPVFCVFWGLRMNMFCF